MPAERTRLSLAPAPTVHRTGRPSATAIASGAWPPTDPPGSGPSGKLSPGWPGVPRQASGASRTTGVVHPGADGRSTVPLPQAAGQQTGRILGAQDMQRGIVDTLMEWGTPRRP